MFQYRPVLVRRRAGGSGREVARAGLMGCDKLGELGPVAAQQGWRDAACALPDAAVIAAALGQRRRLVSSTISRVEPHRTVVMRWFDAGVQGRAIPAAPSTPRSGANSRFPAATRPWCACAGPCALSCRPIPPCA